MTKLEQAARALLAHWDTPAWKYLKPTGDLMADLREALDHSGEADEMVAEQAEQERKYGELAGTHNWTPPNYTDEQWQKLDQEYQDHVAEQALQKLSDFHQSIERNGHWSDCSTHNEPAYPNGECDCGGYPAEQEPVAVVDEIATRLDGTPIFNGVGKVEVGQKLYAAPVRTKDLTPHEITALIREGAADGGWQGFAQRVIAAAHERDKHGSPSWETVDDAIAAEREACAKVCENLPTPKDATTLTHIPTLETCAAAIRARGNNK